MNWKKAIAILFSLINIGISIVMFLPSRENTMLGSGALWFFLGSFTVLWTTYYFLRNTKTASATILFFLIAIAISGSAFPIYLLTERISSNKSDQIEANFRATKVSDFHDETFFSEEGNPLGIRISYTFVAPTPDRYAPFPSVSNGKSRVGSFYALKTTIDPLPDLDPHGTPLSGDYTAKIPYKITVHLVPNFLLPAALGKNSCIFFADGNEEKMVVDSLTESFEVNIDGTSFSSSYGSGAHSLGNQYRLNDFYEGMLKEGFKKCIASS